MSLFAVQWYEYTNQAPQWHAFWQDLAHLLPVDGPVTFHGGPTGSLWETGAYDLTWACGGDIAFNPGQFLTLAVPIFAASDLSPGTYCSFVVRRRKSRDANLDTLCVGLNAPASVSGHLALARWWHSMGLNPPAKIRLTGGHEASVQALLSGHIDLAALDSQGFSLLVRAYPRLQTDCEIIAKTHVLPAPPLCLPGDVTARREAAWRNSLQKADKALCSGILEDQGLGLVGFHLVTSQTYANLAHRLKSQISEGSLLTDLPGV